MRFRVILMGLTGLLFVASSLTEEGLLPSGHGPGAVFEMILGVWLIFISIYGLLRPQDCETTVANN